MNENYYLIWCYTWIPESIKLILSTAWKTHALKRANNLFNNVWQKYDRNHWEMTNIVRSKKVRLSRPAARKVRASSERTKCEPRYQICTYPINNNNKKQNAQTRQQQTTKPASGSGTFDNYSGWHQKIYECKMHSKHWVLKGNTLRYWFIEWVWVRRQIC